MGYLFPDVILPQVVNVLSTMHQVSPSQASSAYSALLKLPDLTLSSFDPAVRAFQRRWTTSVPKYVVFWKGEQLVAFLAAQKLDRSWKIHVRARLIIVFRLVQLYRSSDLSNMFRNLATFDGRWFVPTRRKGWANLRRGRVMHTRPSTCCGAADSPRTPCSKHAEGGGGEEVAEQQGVGPTTPESDVAPALPLHPTRPRVRSRVRAIQGWRSSPRFMNQLGKWLRLRQPCWSSVHDRRRAQPPEGSVHNFSWMICSDLFLGYLNCHPQKN